jgi:ubiquinone/menaquinone biosynthesis C-methylase UbiE
MAIGMSVRNPDRYYSEKLSAEKLRRCYEIASPRVRQYLEAEIDHVLHYIGDNHSVLELGCGYGRVVRELCRRARRAVGIDTSRASLELAVAELHGFSNYELCVMDAVCLGFRDNVFDLTACIQNGISAFKANQMELIRESVRVTKPGGRVLFSSYSEIFWPDRLQWFQRQSEEGLLGKIDYDRTGDGIIICKDGFKATTVSAEQFLDLTSRLNLNAEIAEVDKSSLFCEIVV